MCATFNGAASEARRRSGTLLTAEFAFARFVLYTENCHKYTRTQQRRAQAYAYALIHTIANILICLLFASCYRKSDEKITTFFSTAIWLQLTHLIHGRFGQVQADGAA